MSRIALVGPRGSGKTSTGRALAALLGHAFLDTDELVQAETSQSIADLFLSGGEAEFRLREAAVLERAIRQRDCVLATGGGIVTAACNRKTLRKAKHVVWLTADADTLWGRIEADATTARPVLLGGGRDEVAALLLMREPWYREVATFQVDTAERTPEEVAAVIVAEIESRS